MSGLKSKISTAIKKGDLSKKAFCSFVMACGYSNMSLQALQIRYKTFRYIKRKYEKTVDCARYSADKGNSADAGKDNIWVCWFQGYDAAPELIKACISSIYRYMPDKNIRLITAENMFEFVQFPDFVIKKWKNGIITDIHLSDLLRTELLIRYGGLWVDATVLLTGRVPEFAYSGKFFAYSYYAAYQDITIKYNSWFIFAERDCRVLKALRDLLYAYWRKENKIREYFLWHLLFSIVAEKFPVDFSDTPYVLDDVPLHLGRKLSDEYDETNWKIWTGMTCVHKLTRKGKLPDADSDTFYGKIIHDFRENQ